MVSKLLGLIGMYIAIYFALLVLVLCGVIVCGGNIFEVPTGVFIVIGIASGLLSAIIINKLE